MGFLSDLWEDTKEEASETWDNLKDGDIGSIFEDLVNGTVNVMSLGLYEEAKDLVGGMGDLPAPESNMSDRKNTVRAPANPRSVIYGRAKVGGQVAYFEASGDDARYMHLIVVFAAHSCKDIHRVYFGDDVAVSKNFAPGFSGHVVTGDYDGIVDFHIETGKQTGVPQKILDLTPNNWTLAHKLLGQTYIYLRLHYDKDAFRGLPAITAEVDGKDDIDLGNGTTGWTDNHALCVKDYLLWDRGFRATPDELDLPSFERAAAIADEMVHWDDESERRYTINGAFKLNTTPYKNVQAMLKAGAAVMSYSQGIWSITPGAYQEPVEHYDESDLIGGVQFTPGASKADRINTATGTFISPGHDYEETDFVPISVPTYMDRDGEELTADLKLPFTNSGTMARRLGKIAIEQSRFGVAARVTLKHYAIDRKIGERIRLSINTLGWVGKVFRITKITFSLSSGMSLSLREDAPAIYSWDEDENLVVPVPPAVSLPNARFVIPPIGLAIVEDSYQDTNEDTRVRANFLYQPGGASTGAYDVEYKLQNASVWQRAYSAWTDTKAPISDLPPGAYTFRVRGINGIGIKSEWASINHTFEGIENYWPLPVADLQLEELTDTPPSPRAQFSTIRCTITPPTDPLFSHALIEYQLDGDKSWVVSGPTDAQERRDIVVIADGLGYRVRAFSVSTTGIVSATPVVRTLGVSDIENPSDIPNVAPLNAVTGLSVEGGGTSFSGSVAKIIWQDPNRGSLYVKEYAVEIRTPGQELLRSVVTSVPEYSYTAEANAEDTERLTGAPGTNRSFVVTVRVVGRLDGEGVTHQSPDTSALIENPPPSLPTNLVVAPGYQLIKISFDKPADLDYTETRVWMGEVTGFEPSDANQVAATYGGPITLAGLTDGTDYFIRVATYDAYGKGPTSSEFAVSTADLGLSPWATVTDVDRAFIEANMSDEAIPGTKIDKITAGQIVTGTLAATESISAGDPLTEPYTMTLGGKAFGVDVALISVEQNATGDAIFAAFESGRVQLNANANVYPDGGILLGDQSRAGDYIEFDGTRIIIQTPEFSLDANGNATLTGDFAANSVSTPGLTIDSAGNLTHDNFELNSDGSASFSGALSAASGSFEGSISTPGLTITSAGNLVATGTVKLGTTTDFVEFTGSQVKVSKLRAVGDIYIGNESGSIGFLTPWTGYVGTAIQELYAGTSYNRGRVDDLLPLLNPNYGSLGTYTTRSETGSSQKSVGGRYAFSGLSGSWEVMSIISTESDQLGITTYKYLIAKAA